jgi:hypothetical protein
MEALGSTVAQHSTHYTKFADEHVQVRPRPLPTTCLVYGMRRTQSVCALVRVQSCMERVLEMSTLMNKQQVGEGAQRKALEGMMMDLVGLEQEAKCRRDALARVGAGAGPPAGVGEMYNNAVQELRQKCPHAGSHENFVALRGEATASRDDDSDSDIEMEGGDTDRQFKCPLMGTWLENPVRPCALPRLLYHVFRSPPAARLTHLCSCDSDCCCCVGCWRPQQRLQRGRGVCLLQGGHREPLQQGSQPRPCARPMPHPGWVALTRRPCTSHHRRPPPPPSSVAAALTCPLESLPLSCRLSLSLSDSVPLSASRSLRPALCVCVCAVLRLQQIHPASERPEARSRDGGTSQNGEAARGADGEAAAGGAGELVVRGLTGGVACVTRHGVRGDRAAHTSTRCGRGLFQVRGRHQAQHGTQQAEAVARDYIDYGALFVSQHKTSKGGARACSICRDGLAAFSASKHRCSSNATSTAARGKRAQRRPSAPQLQQLV